jgi:hypothetical protein
LDIARIRAPVGDALMRRVVFWLDVVPAHMHTFSSRNG